MVELIGTGRRSNLLRSAPAHFRRLARRQAEEESSPSTRSSGLGTGERTTGSTPTATVPGSVEHSRSLAFGRPSVGRHRKAEVCATDFRLLFVCTGNICRSPFAELLTRHLIVGRLGGREAARFDVSSAGVQAVVGASMHPDSRSQLAPWWLDGAPADGFVARQLRSSMVASAHLVLGASPGHRSAVLERAPDALGNVFGLREFARLTTLVDPAALPTGPVARAHALIGEVRHLRGLAPPAEPNEDDVPDPMGKPAAAHRAAALMIEESVRTIVDAVAPRATPRSAYPLPA